MPRGNDPDAAREFQDRYETTGNAERLIEANRYQYGADLRAAGQLHENVEASRKLTAAEAADAVGEDEDAIQSWAVRGPFIVAVVDDYHDDGAVKGTRKVSVRRDGEDAGPSATVKGRARKAQALREAVAEADEEVAEANRKAQEKANEKASKAAQEAQQESEKQQQDQEQKGSEQGQKRPGPRR